ncbi:MAG: hypothetical protein NZ529_05140 [Cytophagaceae bacterium]|nr:hypothetical protein [Cytophagaceae bacterium]MDW8456161.1 C1 family peptidase [Cytophagaceae bacterium]
MPVRMTEDDNRSNRDNRGGGSSGGSWGWIALLGFLFFAFRKYPKLTIAVLIILAIGYFFWGGSIGNSPTSGGVSKGCAMKLEVFDRAEVFEPLASEKNSLPARVTLEKYCPERLSQGQQGSCVGWASAYAARTILEAVATGADPNEICFSPSFLYNQIGLEGCQGAYIVDAMNAMMEIGSLPKRLFPYDPNSCSRQPTDAEKTEASRYLICGYNRLTLDHNKYEIDLLAIKQNIAQGAPVVIGMDVGGTFESEQIYGANMWRPTQDDYNNKDRFGGHAMCVIGYDDTHEGGAFQIMNSWGKEFGNNGLFWMKYEDFRHFIREAYGLYPLAKKNSENKNKLNVTFGLVDNATKNYIRVEKKAGNVFETPVLQKGTRFKIEINNSEECYTYIFGQETDGSCYVLFPYTPKHSPYCGITGTRLFPKNESLELDQLGSKDIMAIVVSKKQLHYEEIKNAANRSGYKNFKSMLEYALGDILTDATMKGGDVVSINSDNAEGKAALMVFEINKK